MTLRQRIALLLRRFSPLEERLFAAVRGVLPLEALDTFDAQVQAINRVQRHPEWTEIAFYSMRRGKVDWSLVPLFPRVNEFPLAEVRFVAGSREFKARLTSIGGHIFDFAITPSVRDAAFSAWEGDPSAVLVSNPLDSAAPPYAEPVPEAWTRFLADRASADPRGWSLHEVGAEYRVALDEGEFLVLGERRGEDFLLYRIEPGPSTFFVQRGHDARPERLQGSLSEWMSSESDPESEYR
jgi:hypothetical protein